MLNQKSRFTYPKTQRAGTQLLSMHCRLGKNWQNHPLTPKTKQTSKRKENLTCQVNFLALEVAFQNVGPVCSFKKAAAKESIQTHYLPSQVTWPFTVQAASSSTVQDCAATFFLFWAGDQLKEKKHQKCSCFFNSTSCQNMNVFVFGNLQHWHRHHRVLLQCSTSTFSNQRQLNVS